MKPRNPVFSLAHATCRLPDGWKAAAEAWQRNADNPFQVQYILCVHASDFPHLPTDTAELTDLVVVNDARSCSVDNWNRAARAAQGKVLLSISDDWKPCEHWDSLLKCVIPDLEKDYAVWTSTGGNDGLCQFVIETASYYRRKGWMFYPEYESMYCDNDFMAMAQADGVLIDCRTTLPMFEHCHPSFGRGTWDETYAKENRHEAYRIGAEVFKRRQREGFMA